MVAAKCITMRSVSLQYKRQPTVPAATAPHMTHDSPVLYLFSGLPGTGKSTLAQLIAQRLKAVYLRIDTIEQGLIDLCAVDVQGEGYRLAYRIAADNLRQGMSVVADCCNPIELTRREWEQVARDAQARHVNIEVVCSDIAEHRRRIETRLCTVPGMKLPTWHDVMNREYDDWTTGRIVIDTSKSVADCVAELLAGLSRALTRDMAETNPPDVTATDVRP